MKESVRVIDGLPMFALGQKRKKPAAGSRKHRQEIHYLIRFNLRRAAASYAGRFMRQNIGQLMTKGFQRSRFATNGNGAKDPRNQNRAMLCFVKDSARGSRVVSADGFDSARDVGNDGFIKHDKTPLRELSNHPKFGTSPRSRGCHGAYVASLVCHGRGRDWPSCFHAHAGKRTGSMQPS